jgi:hypothetical protein
MPEPDTSLDSTDETVTSNEHDSEVPDIPIQLTRQYTGDMTGVGSQALRGNGQQREASWVDYRSQLEFNDAKRSSSSVNLQKALPDPHSGDESPTKRLTPTLHVPMLDINGKRYSSLPRTPSPSSIARSSLHGDYLGVLREDSFVQPRPVRRIKSKWPEAMSFADVLIKRTPHDRAVGYARKLVELANHYSGLVDWVDSTKRSREYLISV